jgi:hypothetical protein
MEFQIDYLDDDGESMPMRVDYLEETIINPEEIVLPVPAFSLRLTYPLRSPHIFLFDLRPHNATRILVYQMIRYA